MNIERTSCDVLVLGSGGAGLRAAYEALKRGSSVVLATKGKVNRSGATLLAGANVSADVMCDGASLYRLGIRSGDRTDTPERWLADILHEGFYVNRRALVESYVEHAPARVAELLDAGAPVTGAEEGGRQVGISGSAILDALYRMVGTGDLLVMQDAVLCSLLQAEDGTVSGALLLDLPAGALRIVEAGAVVLATGGMHGCYSFNSGTTGLCGEGQAAAIAVGAEMTNMEMTTFCPNVIFAPQRFRGSILPYILISNGFGRLENRDGEPFLHKYFTPSVTELALNSEWNKLLLSYAIFSEAHAGLGDEHGGVRFTAARIGAARRAELETILPQLKTGIYKEVMALHDAQGGLSVHAAAHYFNGGVTVNERMETTVPGLFAAGECSGGLFGANRVAAATTQMLVQGAIAGESAVLFAKNRGTRTPSADSVDAAVQAALPPVNNTRGDSPSVIRAAAAAAISESAGIVRDEDGMRAGLRALDELDARPVSFPCMERRYNRGWLDYLEGRAIRVCGRAILEASLVRRESRGVFIRSDCFFTDDDAFLAETSLSGAEARLVPLTRDPALCPGGKRPYFENLEAVTARLSYGGKAEA